MLNNLPVIPVAVLWGSEYEFEISFQYHRLLNGVPYGVAAYVTLIRTNTGPGMPMEEATFTGEAMCHPSDQFCKETGRKLALTRAMAQLEGQVCAIKALRKTLWELYRLRDFNGTINLVKGD